MTNTMTRNTRTGKIAPIVAGMLSIMSIPTLYYLGQGEKSSLVEQSLKEDTEIPMQMSVDADVLHPRYTVFLRQYAPEIRAVAAMGDVPPEIIAAGFVEENERRFIIEDIGDDLKMVWNNTFGFRTGMYANVSLGVGQVNIDTALELNAKYMKNAHTHREKSPEEVAQALNQRTEENILYSGLYWSELLSRQNRSSSYPSVFDDVHLIAVLGTEYVQGPTETSIHEAMPSCHGAYFAQYLSNTPVRRTLGEDAVTITFEQQMNMRDFGHCSVDALCDDNKTGEQQRIEYRACLAGA